MKATLVLNLVATVLLLAAALKNLWEGNHESALLFGALAFMSGVFARSGVEDTE